MPEDKKDLVSSERKRGNGENNNEDSKRKNTGEEGEVEVIKNGNEVGTPPDLKEVSGRNSRDAKNGLCSNDVAPLAVLAAQVEGDQVSNGENYAIETTDSDDIIEKDGEGSDIEIINDVIEENEELEITGVVKGAMPLNADHVIAFEEPITDSEDITFGEGSINITQLTHNINNLPKLKFLRTSIIAQTEADKLFPVLRAPHSDCVNMVWRSKNSSQKIGNLRAIDIQNIRRHDMPISGEVISAYLNLMTTSMPNGRKVVAIDWDVVNTMNRDGVEKANEKIGKDLHNFECVLIPMRVKKVYPVGSKIWKLIFIEMKTKTINIVDSKRLFNFQVTLANREYKLFGAIALSLLKVNFIAGGHNFDETEWTTNSSKHLSPGQSEDNDTGISICVDATLLAHGYELDYRISERIEVKRLLAYRLLKNKMF